MQMTKVDFRNAVGWRLAANLALPGETSVPLVIFAHGLGSSKESPRNVVIASRLWDCGIGSLLMDLSGHGESEGSPDVPIEQFAQDILSAFAYVAGRAEVASDRIGVSGSSLGGAAALYATAVLGAQARTLVLRAPPLDGYAQLLPRVRGPVLVIAGGRDPLLPALRSACSGTSCTLLVIEGAGHLFEGPASPEAAAKATTDWFVANL
jgi:pimeloyl-ACP methyl ester carboxylesterase